MLAGKTNFISFNSVNIFNIKVLVTERKIFDVVCDAGAHLVVTSFAKTETSLREASSFRPKVCYVILCREIYLCDRPLNSRAKTRSLFTE